jgi:hypothetical protein
MAELYNFGSIVPYFIAITANLLELINVSANFWFLNRNGIKFFEIFYNYEIEFNRNQIILFIIWICHLLLYMALLIYKIFSIKHGLVRNSSGFILVMAAVVFKICSFIGIWAVSFLTWIISIHFYEFLIIVENNLKHQISRNLGNFFTSDTSPQLKSGLPTVQIKSGLLRIWQSFPDLKIPEYG